MGVCIQHKGFSSADFDNLLKQGVGELAEYVGWLVGRRSIFGCQVCIYNRELVEVTKR